MSPPTIGALGILALIVLTLLRVPLGAAMGLVGLVGYAAIDGWANATYIFGTTPDGLVLYSFSVLPLFILMGVLASQAGMSAELFRAANAIFAGRRGALAMATIGGCAGFAAICGSSLATAGTFTRICVPEMRRYGYDDGVATGSVAAAGTLGILIPPSVVMVIYAMAAQESVPALFAAGLIPGLLLTALFIGSVWVVAHRRPELVPTTPSMPFKERIRASVAMWKLALLFLIAVGGIYTGWFSPTEAAGIASFAALIIALFSKQVNWKKFLETLDAAIQTTAMMMFIILGAWMFAAFIVQTRLPNAVVEIIQALGIPALGVICIVIVFYLVLGCFMESVAIVLLTVPVFLPVVQALGYDPVWYGVLMVVLVEVGLITPPVGLNIFIIRAQLPDVPLRTVYTGIIPFLIADAILVVLLIAFPELALWLPRILF